MQFLRKWIRGVLGFSARETNGFIILLPLLAVIVLAEPTYRLLATRPVTLTPDATLDSIVASWNTTVVTAEDTSTRGQPTRKRPFMHFEFDPNTASLDDLKRLGFSDRIAQRVVTYRQKGGKFITASDLGKIYGMDTLLLKRLGKYIVIPSATRGQAAAELPKAAVRSEKEPLAPFDLNEADTSTLKGIYGIGTKLAHRIVKFRSGLGGFVSFNQLSEIYGLDSAVVNRLKKRCFIKNDFVPKQLNLNTSTESEMSTHPYITKSVAKAIAAWRFQHGPFKSVEEIENLNSLLKQEDIVKIVPYLKVED